MGANASAHEPPPPEGSHSRRRFRVRVSVKERYYEYLPRYINRRATLTEEKVRLAAKHWNFIADEVSKSNPQDTLELGFEVCIRQVVLSDHGGVDELWLSGFFVAKSKDGDGENISIERRWNHRDGSSSSFLPAAGPVRPASTRRPHLSV